MIKHLKNKEINFIRWDNCINNAINGSIFAYSWYLNILCEDWEALVLGNYDYVMPILKKVKLGKNIYFTSQLGIRLGVFSNQLLSEDIVNKFIESIPNKNTSIDISLNLFNEIKNKNIKTFSIHELDLIQPYKKIAHKYSEQFKDEVLFAEKNGVTINKGITPNELINFSTARKSKSKPRLNSSGIRKFRMILAYSLRFGLGETYNAYNQFNELCATTFFILSKKKIHLLYASANKTGLKYNAFHLLIDKYIKDHAEKDLTLDIENIISKNKKSFYSGLGAKEYHYQNYYSNNLSWMYRLLIKF